MPARFDLIAKTNTGAKDDWTAHERMLRSRGAMTAVLFIFAFAALAVGMRVLPVFFEVRRARDFLRRAEWEGVEWDWFAMSVSARWKGLPVSFQRLYGSWRMCIASPCAVTLHVTRRDDLFARFKDAFRADALDTGSSAFRFHGSDISAARRLEGDDEVALAMHEVLRGGAELIIDGDGITVEAPKSASLDAAWRLVVAVHHLLLHAQPSNPSRSPSPVPLGDRQPEPHR